MADRFWVGGTGNWSDTAHWAATTGGAGGETVPVAGDVVALDSNSGAAATVTVNAALACASLTVNKSDITLIGAATNAWTVSGAVTLTNGTLNTLSQTCTWGSFSSSNSNTRTLTLGASAIGVTGTGFSWDLGSSATSGLTLNAGTSVITFTANASIRLAQHTYYDIVGTGAGLQPLFTSGGSCHNLSITPSPAVKTDESVIWNSFINVTGTLTITGQSSVNRVLIYSSTLGTPRTITAAAVSLTDVDFMDITGAGAATWSGTRVGLCGGTTGITGTVASGTAGTHGGVKRYGVGAGNWSATATWSETDGGAGGASIPLPQDDVYLTASSGAGTYTMDMPRACSDLICTGFTRTLSSGTVSTYGSVALASGMTHSGGTLWSLCGRGTHSVTCATKTFSGILKFFGPGGIYSLSDAFLGSGAIYFDALASFATNNFSVGATNITFAALNTTASLDFGTSVLTLTGTFGIYPGSNWVISTTAHSIVLTGTAAGSFGATGAGKTWGSFADNSVKGTNALTITGNNTFNGTFTVSGKKGLNFAAGSVQTFNGAVSINGTAGNLVTLQSSVSGSAYTFTKTSGVVSCDFISVKDSHAGGGALFFAGKLADSVDVSGNTGWVFTDPALSGSKGMTGAASGLAALGATGTASLDAAAWGAEMLLEAATAALEAVGSGELVLSESGGVALSLDGAGQDVIADLATVIFELAATGQDALAEAGMAAFELLGTTGGARELKTILLRGSLVHDLMLAGNLAGPIELEN